MAFVFNCHIKKVSKKNKNVGFESENDKVESDDRVIHFEKPDILQSENDEISTEPQNSMTWKSVRRQVNRVLLRCFTFIIVMNWVFYFSTILIGSEYSSHFWYVLFIYEERLYLSRLLCYFLLCYLLYKSYIYSLWNIKSNKNELPAHYTVVGVCFCQTSFMLHYKVNNLFSEALPTIKSIGHYCKKI